MFTNDVIFEGGGGVFVGQMVIFSDLGWGVGVQKGSKFDDVIYAHPYLVSLIFRVSFIFRFYEILLLENSSKCVFSEVSCIRK